MVKRFFSALLGLWLLVHGIGARAQVIEFSPTLKTPASWPLGRFQAELSKALTGCGARVIRVDQRLGADTGDGIARLRLCSGFQTNDAEKLARKLTPNIWSKLMREPFPSIADRSRLLTYNYEGTDYTRFIWNVGQPSDPYAFGTWGPFGATLAAGGEVQAIIRGVAQQPGGTEKIKRAFSVSLRATPPIYRWRSDFCKSHRITSIEVSGADLLLSLSIPLSVKAQRELQSEFCDENRYGVWPAAFQILGDDQAVIASYNAKYARQNKIVAEHLANIYFKLGIPVTEIDWAFFLDRGTQYTTNLQSAEAAVRTLSPGASAGRRRLAISRSSLPSEDAKHHVQRHLRIGRDMAFIAGSTSAEISSEERSDWQYTGPLTAEQVGLSDLRTFSGNPFS